MTGAASSDEVWEAPFGEFLESVPDAILGVDESGSITIANRQAEELFGYLREELLGSPVERLIPERYHHVHPRHRGGYFGHPRTRPMGAGVELFALRKDGAEFPAEISLSTIPTDRGPLAIAAVRDVTDRAESERERALQEQLSRARRLESVGQLAGGIAHDFNNILGVIMNYAQFVSEDLKTAGLSEDSQPRQDVKEIRRAAKRAAALTRQLLIFSRREVVKPEVLDLTKLVRELEMLLERALGERVDLRMELAGDEAPIEADPGQIEQVLVNLAVNARDAMPEGGTLVIEVDAVQLDSEFSYMHPDTPPGGYVRLKVSDTGTPAAPRPYRRDRGRGRGARAVRAHGGPGQAAGGRLRRPLRRSCRPHLVVVGPLVRVTRAGGGGRRDRPGRRDRHRRARSRQLRRRRRLARRGRGLASPLYFAAGAVASRLWAALERDGAATASGAARVA